MLTLTPINLKTANAFVQQYHRHHKPTRGHKFSIGVSENGALVGVAICGRPVARRLDDGYTLEVNRLCTDTLVWERALSLRNPWIQQMAQYKTPEELDRNFVKKYIEQVTVTLLDDGQVEISLTMKTDEWKQMLSRIEVEGTDSGTKE